MGWYQRWQDKRREAWVEQHLGSQLDMMGRWCQVMGVKSITPQELVEVWRTKTPTWTTWTLANAVEQGLKLCATLYACIRRRADAFASVELFAVRQVRGGGWERLDDSHELQRLLKKPNPYWSRGGLQGRVLSHIDLAGDAYLAKVRSSERGKPQQIWPLCPDLIAPMPGGKGEPFVAGYAVKDKTGKILEVQPPADIIHWRQDNPNDDYVGLAPLYAAGRTVDCDVSAVAWNASALENRAVPDLIISHGFALTESQYTEARARIREQFQGSANARTPWVLGSDAKVQQLSLTPVQMDFLPGREYSRTEICSVYGVPPPLIGDYEKATLANIEVSRTIFWLDTIIPTLDAYVSVLDKELAAEWGEDIGIAYDLSNVSALYPLLGGRMDTAKALFEMGVPVEQINERLSLGLSEFPGWDISWQSSTKVPAGVMAPTGGIEEEE